MSEDNPGAVNYVNKKREAKRPMTTEENRNDSKFSKRNQQSYNYRGISPDIPPGGSGGFNNNIFSEKLSKSNNKDMANQQKQTEKLNEMISNPVILENETDERLRYLLKYGKVKKFEQDFGAIFAELQQIPGVWIFYRKQE